MSTLQGKPAMPGAPRAGRADASNVTDAGDVGRVCVWDAFVRVFHWTLVASFFTAWWFTEHIGWLHKGAGYLALALVAARCVWGFVGSEHARFANFVPGPRKLVDYLGRLVRAREPRHLGHNPAGAVMILFHEASSWRSSGRRTVARRRS